MSNSDQSARLLAEGYSPLWHDGHRIYTKPDRRTPLQRELGLYDGGELRPSIRAYRIAMRETGVGFGLEGVFARALGWAFEARPRQDGARRMIEDAARTATFVGSSALRNLAEREGFAIAEHPSYQEAVVREIADTFPKLETVRRMFTNVLFERRAQAFADKALTHGDPNLYVFECHELRSQDPLMFDEIDPKQRITTEQIRMTILRSIEYIDFIERGERHDKFFRLYSLLTRMLLVGEAVLGGDF